MVGLPSGVLLIEFFDVVVEAVTVNRAVAPHTGNVDTQTAIIPVPKMVIFPAFLCNFNPLHRNEYIFVDLRELSKNFLTKEV